MNSLNKIILGSCISILFLCCGTMKKLPGSEKSIACLIPYPPTYHNVRFNPRWISEEKINRIVEREYLDGREGRIHLVTVLDYDEKGYLKTKYSGHGYPADDSPNVNDIFSKWEYATEILDSFVVLSSRIVRYHDGEGPLDVPDTLSMSYEVFNVNKARVFKNEHGEIRRRYLYDKKDRLVKELDSKDKELYSIIYHDDGRLEFKEYSFWKKEYYSSWMSKDAKGRIIKYYDESNKSTHEFMYDQQGRMVEDKHWFEGEEPNYHTYEYITDSAR